MTHPLIQSIIIHTIITYFNLAPALSTHPPCANLPMHAAIDCKLQMNEAYLLSEAQHKFKFTLLFEFQTIYPFIFKAIQHSVISSLLYHQIKKDIIGGIDDVGVTAVNMPTICFDYNRKIPMEDYARTVGRWSNKELRIINRQKERLRQIEEETLRKGILHRDTNSLEFYEITPKEELPKFLQKMRFQTLHLKEKDIATSIKVFRKENRRPEEQILRKKLREEGHIMLLSEIYQHLGENCEPKKQTGHLPSKLEALPDLDEWQKQRREERVDQTCTAPRPRGEKDSRSSQVVAKQFKLGADYKGEIERSLGIIEVTHASQFNLMSRYQLVENSSKLLKRELDEKKAQIEESIKSKMKQLYEARTEYHNFFEEKNRLKLEERLHNEELSKEDSFRISHKSITNIRNDKSTEVRLQKRSLLQANQCKIQRAKASIAALEEAIAGEEEELRKMMMAEKLYFKISLRNGNDVRETGLVWIIKKLQIKEEDMGHYEYPQFLDRRCRLFLVQKAASEEEEELLLEEKRKFVNEIGRASSESKLKYKSIMSPKELMGDRIIESDMSNDPVPKKYRRSLKKITQLNEEYLKNSSLLELRERNKVMEISADLQGLSNKEIYSQIGERIKRLDLSKMKKDKLGMKKMKLLEYQSLLEKIKNIHIKLEEMDLQMENYLLTHYKDNRNLYFMQAAACFGYKRAYSMIIKHFSWKTYHEQN